MSPAHLVAQNTDPLYNVPMTDTVWILPTAEGATPEDMVDLTNHLNTCVIYESPLTVMTMMSQQQQESFPVFFFIKVFTLTWK